jgi:ABC-type Fe3+/spermidine/putrescine transport system ATPase subunit
MSLKLEKITKKYDEFRLEVDLEFEKQQISTILGPSGCGKSTILQIISGIVQANSGSVFLNGNDIGSVPIHKRNISLVFQDLALFPHMNVYKNIAYGLESRSLEKSIIEEKVKAMLKLMQLESFEKRKIQELSGGEQQRVALARALVTEPEVLLMDEPFSALDKKLRVSLRNEIKKLQKALGLTIIYVTHDQEEALTLSDQIFLMNQGNLVQQASPKELYEKPTTLFAADFLGRSNIIPISSLSQEQTESLDLKYNSGAFIFFRPEHCHLDQKRQSSKKSEFLQFEGEIQSSEYFGKSCLYQVKAKSISILIESSQLELTIGRLVMVSVSLESILILN